MLYYIIAAAVFGITELATGTFWLLALAIVSALMAGLLWVFPDINLACHLITIGILGVVTYKVMARYKGFKKEPKEDLNNPLMRYLGYSGVVTKIYEENRIQVSVADSLWDAVVTGEHAGLVVGTRITVVGFSSSAVMTVERDGPSSP
jgi:membrane protein implicated in regulation of membrane protease activity